MSSFITVWGQFIDHDIVYTKEGKESWPIPVPKCDEFFDPHCHGDKVIDFERSDGDKDLTNIATAWIDASNIYGSTYEVNEVVRAWKHGLLKTSKKIDEHQGEFPPFVHELPEELQEVIGMENEGHRSDGDMFILGDDRANQHPLILSMHVLFWREHNRVARILAHKNPHWDDEKLFQKARRYVIATIQRITYEEYLYWLLARPFPEHDYYDDEVDPRIHTFFATVAFRYAHSEVDDLIKRSESGHYGSFPKWHHSKLYHYFFDSYFVVDCDLASLFEGLAYQVQRSPDTHISDSIRNFLFPGNDSHPHFDLFAIDIQRGRNHKIPSYNHARKAYGLYTVDSWHEFDSLDKRLGENEHNLKSHLSKVYRNPWEADAIVAGLAADWVRTHYSEEHHDYSNLGDLFEVAIISQFHRLRVGDRFFYSRNLDEVNCHGLPPVQHRTLADVIRDNVKHVHIPDEVFKVWY
jgi:hypothetical protein